MNIDIIYFTYNRIECTKITLPKLLNSSSLPFNLTIVDNCSKDETREYLVNFVKSYENIKLIFNYQNKGLTISTNDFWNKSGADLIGKIDNDIIVENGWLEKLVLAHRKVPDLAVVGGFHFSQNIFNRIKCSHNMYHNNGIDIIRQPHIGGNYLAKRKHIIENGLIKEVAPINNFKLGGWTGYQKMLTKKGYIIGYYFPLISFKHLHLAKNRYYKEVRGMSRRKYMKWENKIGEKMLYSNWNFQEA